jgi:hypothetical protein
MLVNMNEQNENNRAVHNIISAIVESNINESEEYVFPKNRGNIIERIHDYFVPVKNQTYQVIFNEGFVGIRLSISAIDYKGIIGKIEKLQARIQEEVYEITGYKVSYIHVKLS